MLGRPLRAAPFGHYRPHVRRLSYSTVQALPIGRADETDTASALARLQKRATGLSAEIDTALTLSTASNSYIIPPAQLIDWTAAGVVGGVSAYAGRTLSSTAQQTTLSSASTQTNYGNDSGNATSIIQAAITAAASGTYVLIPPGIYQCGPLTMKSNVTLRGAGAWCKSTSNVTIPSSYPTAVTFTVPAGLGYLAGVQVRVWRHANRAYFMQGSVTSYSGTSLVLSITSSQGGGNSFSDWRVSITTLKSLSGASTYLAFGSGGVSTPVAGSTARAVTGGNSIGSTSITLASGSPTVSSGQCLLISELNATDVTPTGDNGTATWADNWGSGSRARGQICEVTSVAGNVIGIYPPLFTAYPNTPLASPASWACTRAGVENLQVFGQSSSGCSATIGMDLAYECWVKGCDFDFVPGSQCDNALIDFSYRCEIRENHFYDAFFHGAGEGYGLVHLRFKTGMCRIESNICERMLDAIATTRGAAGNVVAYNYCFGGWNQDSNYLTKSITMNHCAHPQFNLIEGNITTGRITADGTWGSSSDTVALRNYAVGTSQSRGPYDNTRTISAATVNNTDTNYAMEAWEGQLRYSFIGNVIGNRGNWVGRNPVRKLTYPQTMNYSNPPACISVGKYQDGNPNGPLIMTNPAATFIDHGNWDVVTNGQVWDGGISNHTLPTSYAYSSKPAWWGNAVAWPPIDPASVPSDLTTITNPAKYRYDNGIVPTAIDSIATFESVVMPTGAPWTVANLFIGAHPSDWYTSADPEGSPATPGAITGVTFVSAASHAPDKNWIAGGTVVPASSSSLGFRKACTSLGIFCLSNSGGITGTTPVMGFHWRWNGSQVDWQPRDIAGFRYRATGEYQLMQIYDGATPYVHIHTQYAPSGVGPNVNIAFNRWYWVTIKWGLASGTTAQRTTTLSIYDAQNAYALVGTSSVVMDVNANNRASPDLALFGYSKYIPTDGGVGQSFDYDNVIVNWDGTPIPVPG